MSKENIKNKIASLLKGIAPREKTHDPRMKKSVSSIFSQKSNKEQIEKISPLFQATSPRGLQSTEKPEDKKVPKQDQKNIIQNLAKKIKPLTKSLLKEFGISTKLISSWGLDIGIGYIKLVNISHENEKPLIKKIYCEPIPPQFRHAGSARDEYLKILLKKIAAQYKVKNEFISVSITDPSLVFRTINLPLMPSQKIPDLVKWTLQKQHHVNLDKEMLRIIVLGEKGERGIRQIEILTTVISKEVVTKHYNLVKQGGWQPIAIEPSALSLAFCFLQNYCRDPEEVVIVLNIGTAQTMFNIMINQKLVFNRNLDFGNNQLLNELSTNMNISLEAAQKQLDTWGVPKTDLREISRENLGEEEFILHYALHDLLQQFVNKIRTTFDFYSYQLTHSAIQKIDKILITGNGVKIKNLDKSLSAYLKTPVEILNPFNNIQISEGIDKDSINRFASQLSIAVGLALRRTP